MGDTKYFKKAYNKSCCQTSMASSSFMCYVLGSCDKLRSTDIREKGSTRSEFRHVSSIVCIELFCCPADLTCCKSTVDCPLCFPSIYESRHVTHVNVHSGSTIHISTHRVTTQLFSRFHPLIFCKTHTDIAIPRTVVVLLSRRDVLLSRRDVLLSFK